MLEIDNGTLSLWNIRISERVSSQSSIDWQYGPGDVTRNRRTEKYRQRSKLLGLAIAAYRDFLARLFGAKFLRVLAPYLLAHDAARRNAIHGDAVGSDFAGQALRPCVHCGFGRCGSDQAFRLRFAGDVDDPSPALGDHLWQHRMSEL